MWIRVQDEADNFVHNSRSGNERVSHSKDVQTERKTLRMKKKGLMLKCETENTQEIIQTLETIIEGIKNDDNNYNCMINDPLLYNCYF
jgi:hypothetical protein